MHYISPTSPELDFITQLLTNYGSFDKQHKSSLVLLFKHRLPRLTKPLHLALAAKEAVEVYTVTPLNNSGI